MRSFIAIPVSEEVKLFYSKICRDMRKGAEIHVVRQDKMHITLSFFNHLKEEDVEKVKEAILSLRLENIEIKCDSIATFKRRGIPSIIYIDTKSDKLSSFVQALRKKLKKMNITFDEKPFKSHITIGRIKEIKDEELFNKMYKKTCMTFEKQSFTTSNIVLYESDMLNYKEVFNINI